MRTAVVIGTDANGHVGTIRDGSQGEEYRGHRSRDDDYEPIGPHGAEEENNNGKLMR